MKDDENTHVGAPPTPSTHLPRPRLCLFLGGAKTPCGQLLDTRGVAVTTSIDAVQCPDCLYWISVLAGDRFAQLARTSPVSGQFVELRQAPTLDRVLRAIRSAPVAPTFGDGPEAKAAWIELLRMIYGGGKVTPLLWSSVHRAVLKAAGLELGEGG